MSDFYAWMQEELERAAREELREYLLSAATGWVAGDGVSTSEYLNRLDKLTWVGRYAAAIGQDRATTVRAEVVAVHLDELAAQAKLAVPATVVDAWRTAAMASLAEGEPLASADRGESCSAAVVREGLLWLHRVRYDRDLFDQSGLPESFWAGWQ